MKSLTLFRHAKTERDADSGRDFDRRLIDRGRNDAKRIGAEIGGRGNAFDLVLSSPAARAAETAELAGLDARFDQRIYDASTGDLLAIVQETASEIDRLALVGHNPGLERLASRLIGQDIEMPTGSLVEIDLPVDQWAEVGNGHGRLARFLKPKALD